MINQAPTLDEFLRVHGLSMASFAGLSTGKALRLCQLDDRSLALLGAAHRERCLVIRGALIDRLARKHDDNDQCEDDADDTDNRDDRSDEGDDEPVRKKSRKKAKPVDGCDDQGESYEERVRAAAYAILAAGAKLWRTPVNGLVLEIFSVEEKILNPQGDS